MRLRTGLLLAAILLALLAAVAGLWLQRVFSPLAAEAPEVVFEISPGESLAGIARRLEADRLVRRALAVEALARWHKLEGDLQSGEFALSAALTPGEIVERIATGKVLTYEVVVPEGFTAAQIGARLAASGLIEAEAFEALVRSTAAAEALGVEGDGLEGYLFPETYRIPRGLPPLEVARTLVDQFHAVWAEIAPAAKAQHLSMREVVTLASIIEKETGAPEERPLIASVFRNRLNREMRLESDPTVIYGIPDFDGNLRRRDLENPDNTYNTYQIRGLPPGPIASPGAESLRATVEPAESEFLFFVSRNNGTHVFSRSYREHVNAVNRYQKNESR